MHGKLEEFSLGDILQLYQISGRTGLVCANREDSPVHRIYVDRGRVSGAGADGWSLVDELRKVEWIDDEVRSQLDYIDRDGGNSGLSLIARALLSPHAWDYFTERQLEQLVYPVLTWTSGEFEARVEERPRVAPLRINQPPQQLVLNAARWEEEIRGAADRGFTQESRWARVSESPPPPRANRNEPCPVTSLMDHPRTLAELAAAAGLSTLRVINQIKALSSAGEVIQVE